MAATRGRAPARRGTPSVSFTVLPFLCPGSFETGAIPRAPVDDTVGFLCLNTSQKLILCPVSFEMGAIPRAPVDDLAGFLCFNTSQKLRLLCILFRKTIRFNWTCAPHGVIPQKPAHVYLRQFLLASVSTACIERADKLARCSRRSLVARGAARTIGTLRRLHPTAARAWFHTSGS